MTPDAAADLPYLRVVRRIEALVEGLDDATAARTVPSCPQWSVRETLAHLVGVAADILAGNLQRAGRDDWTAVQVAARAEAGIGDLLQEWRRTAPMVAPALVGARGGQPVFDALTHELDLRVALGEPLEGDPVALSSALHWLVPNFCGAVGRRGVPPLAVVAEAGTWRGGEGEPVATLRGSDVDVLRSVSGRRCADQVAALLEVHDDAPAGADVRTWWAAFQWGPFTPPLTAIDPA